MGKGGQVLGRQAGLIEAPRAIFRNARYASDGYPRDCTFGTVYDVCIWANRTLHRRHRLTESDPKPPSIGLKFRSAKALFVPSLKRDIVPSIACTRPPAGGAHGKPHPTARIHTHTGRRSSCVAARGAGAAAGHASDRVPRSQIA